MIIIIKTHYFQSRRQFSLVFETNQLKNLQMSAYTMPCTNKVMQTAVVQGLTC